MIAKWIISGPLCSVSSRHFIKGGQTRVLEMLRGGGINYQAVRQNKVKIQGGALRIQGGASAPLCPPLNETLLWVLCLCCLRAVVQPAGHRMRQYYTRWLGWGPATMLQLHTYFTLCPHHPVVQDSPVLVTSITCISSKVRFI